MIALYDGWVFKGTNRMWHNRKLEFLGPWDGSEEEFFKTYHKEFPNEKLAVFKHKFKPVSKELRSQIENYMKSEPFFIELNRDKRIDELFS